MQNIYRSQTQKPGQDDDMLLFKKIRTWISTTARLLEHFPKKMRFTLKDEIWLQSLRVLTSALGANQIKPLNQADAQQRLRQQNDLLAALTTADHLMQVAVEQGALAPSRLGEWSTQAAEIRVITLGWIKSDRRRSLNTN